MLDLSTRRNAASAYRAVGRVEELELIPEHPYPGSDVHWRFRCGRVGCTWTGHLFYSHLRASRGHNRRHPGCTGTPGTYRIRKTDDELLTHLRTVFPDTDFHIHSTTDGDRTVEWTSGPDTHHVQAHLGPNQNLTFAQVIDL
ncbi:hypothetical protein AB0D10_01320 [Kitasatospora sp. NPDC048545]|uniref:hypothetical protein n=1 Tax=Kitasatospora sp. NPDC048545 TaxID=3157208 RepID=UPI0034085AF0